MEKSEHYSSQNNLYDAIDDSRAVMNDKDKHLYNLLHRSTVKKLTFSSLSLKQAEKTAVLQKTGPCPKWYTPWRTRNFALKGNFLYYYKPNTKNIDDSIILGAVYIRGAALDGISMNGSKHVITITPPVPRRAGWSNDETSVFYIKFGSDTEAAEWQKTLKEVANKQR
ncbi:uncharacterized protein [Dysidea avara]|uniref:uncharacterized protein n=1 Tax=Dysidea avara TaxID=196820 RepID=UPI0033279578